MDGGSRVVKDLERLVELHRAGGLSDEEFAAAKRRLLDWLALQLAAITAGIWAGVRIFLLVTT